YNDKYGHTAGDLVLKHISRILTEDLHGGDIAARYGGEEFALILVNKDKAEAIALSDRLRRRIENTPIILRRKKTNITISVGIATSPPDSSLVEDLLRDADRRLYKAKEKGKNQVCAY
ncbi:MAG: GGDEF domain-containing protein, partial [Candidatus Omnitrophica bacterium]|nr:GGDEF domain-containing protein [Candidatus Omnitrophota bacterium]